MLVAGTATPRPESWLELPRLELPRRVDGRRMPPVHLVDMREADPRSGPVHGDTWEALEGVRAAGAKAIVMINRRGFAPWLTCRSCGHHWDCPNCDVSLIVHRHSGRLVCHHCAHSEPLPTVCGECGSTTLSRAGAGTATPRPESWLELPRLELPRRVDGRRMPPVHLVDMREADPRTGPVHAETWEALEAVRAAGAKAIVMINRRGFAPWLTCRSCGHHWDCPNCDVSLIVHRQGGRLVCHHCAHAEPQPQACPECASTTLSRAGAGTERVESLLVERLDPMPVLRLDSDTAAERGAHARILARFDELPSAVLVGTQMVAKGHDFPEVTLSAILDADATLRFPDFRAEERTFAMVAQLAGRSGRGEAGGEVIVQTLAPSASSIEHAARHDSAGFLEVELDRRRALHYPPFSHLARVNFAAELEPKVEDAAAALAGELRRSLPRDAELLGPAPMFRVRNRHRRRILIKADDREAMVAAVREVVERRVGDRSLKDVSVGVDVDPQ